MIAAVIAAAITVAAHSSLPTRTVNANTLMSAGDPRVRIVLPKAARYVGRHTWVLFGIAKGYSMPAGADKGSDDQHIFTLLRSNGYAVPRRMASVRLVHLLDNKRKELMIIYSENAPQNHRIDMDALIRRAQANVRVQRLERPRI